MSRRKGNERGVRRLGRSESSQWSAGPRVLSGSQRQKMQLAIWTSLFSALPKPLPSLADVNAPPWIAPRQSVSLFFSSSHMQSCSAHDM